MNLDFTSPSPEFNEVVSRLRRLLPRSKPVLRLKNVLVPLDFSESSLRALPYASFLSGQFGCGVTLLHVVHLNIVGEERGIPLTRFLDEMSAAAERALGELTSTGWPRPPRIVVRSGEPFAEILHETVKSNVDLIILGRRRRKGLERLLHCVETRIIRRAPCPTLIAI